MARTKVQSELIATNAISGTIIADGAITSTHLAANCVDSSELVTGSIDTIHIAANQVTATKIVTNGVLTRHISDDQVTAAKLANSINTDIATGVTANTTANAALPKAGGTMSGALNMGSQNITNSGTIASGAITSGSHLINASSSAFGGSSVQGFNTDFLVDTGQGYSRHNSYHTGGSNHQFLVNEAGSTTNTVALAINKDANATFAGDITIGNDPGGDAYNTTSPLKIGSTTNAYINIKAGTGHAGGLLVGDSDDDFVGGFIYSNSTDDLSLYSNNAVRMVLNENGRVVIGGGADPRTLGFGDTGVQIEGTGATSASLSIVRNSASIDPPYLIFGKSRGGALGANTVVQDGDYLGNIRFNAADGTDPGNVAAQIHAQIDGTPGANDTPGKLVFSTAADGSNTTTARMTIDSAGDIIIGSTSKIYSSGDTDSYLQFNQANTLRAVIGDSTRMIINTSETVFNEDSGNFDFRIEGDDVSSLFHVSAGANVIQIGQSSYDVATNLESRMPSNRHDIGARSYGAVSGSGQPARWVSGSVAVNTTSAGTQLQIPCTSQANLWRPFVLKIIGVTAEYNYTTGNKGFEVVMSGSLLTSINGLTEMRKSGNVASIAASGMDIHINFTNAYNAGLSDYEGLVLHYELMSITPSYVKMWSAVMN